MKRIKCIILILTLSIIICIIAIVAINNKKSKYGVEAEFPTLEINRNIEKLNNRNQYYILLECVKKFASYASNENYNAIKLITNMDNEESVINYYSFDNVKNICFEEVYVLNGYTYDTFYIRGKNDISSNSKFYFIINLDFSNYTYRIEPITEDKYNELVKNNRMSEEDLTIEKNKYNNFEDIYITDEEMAIKYLEDYTKKALEHPEMAYNLLDEGYRNKRFGKLEKYEEYVKSKEYQLENTTVSKYKVDEKEDYIEYVVVDTYENYYTIKETSVMDYTIMLDNYTVKSEEFISKYNNLEDEKKVATDVEIFIKMISNNDYKNAYNCLANEFKQNYFKTQDDFEKYAQEVFFDDNYITVTDITNKGNVYTCTANLKSGIGAAADSMTKRFAVKLNQNAEFELSFEVE